MTDRVVVFIDYQNVYKGARDAFFERGDRSFRGQFNPRALAELVVADSPFDRALHEVRVYRGLPSPNFDAKSYAASRRQSATWEKLGLVTSISRPVRYPKGWPNSHDPSDKPGEKGIDVSLAIDFVAMAVRGEYDVGIIFSADTDLRPPLEFVFGVAEEAGTYYPRAETAAWRSAPGRSSPRLSLPGKNVWCHMIDKTGFDTVADVVDYNRKWS